LIRKDWKVLSEAARADEMWQGAIRTRAVIVHPPQRHRPA
jgi:hypothetical protein